MNLNLEQNRQRLVLKALNKMGSIKYAAPKLGLSERTVSRLCKDWSIEKKGKEYLVVHKAKIITTHNLKAVKNAISEPENV